MPVPLKNRAEIYKKASCVPRGAAGRSRDNQ